MLHNVDEVSDSITSVFIFMGFSELFVLWAFSLVLLFILSFLSLVVLSLLLCSSLLVGTDRAFKNLETGFARNTCTFFSSSRIYGYNQQVRYFFTNHITVAITIFRTFLIRSCLCSCLCFCRKSKVKGFTLAVCGFFTFEQFSILPFFSWNVYPRFVNQHSSQSQSRI